ncbi:MAG TPA: IclR family transcriptional regulator [Steroidobacteraceae bacterium]|nr:IclR family transcriptional regulator [Steroidobacteraceae bacterium]
MRSTRTTARLGRQALAPERRTADAGPAFEGASNVQARLGSQTLLRGLDVIDVVATGPVKLGHLAARLGLTRSTTHRLASALTDRRYLSFAPHSGYSLGPKLLELGFRVRDQLDLPRVAAPHLEQLALLTEDAVHLGVLERGRVLYLDKVPGRRRINISSRIGELQPVTSTGLGKALILDFDEGVWLEFLRADRSETGRQSARRRRVEISQQEWLTRMRGYVQAGYAYDLEENEDQIRCLAAPIRDFAGRTIAAISVSSAAQYLSEHRMQALSKDVIGAAQRISAGLGWTGRHPAHSLAGDVADGGPRDNSPTPRARGRGQTGGRRK